MTDSNDDICEICKQPILEGQGIYTLHGTHWDCEFPQGYKSAEDLLEEAEVKLAARATLVTVTKRRRAREGEGVVAKKAIAKATTALEKLLGCKVVNVLFWNQQGAYRGPSWDLDRWGLDFEYEYETGKFLKNSASSLESVTQIARGKQVRVYRDSFNHLVITNDLPSTSDNNNG